jgi:hypothetical protein
MSSMIKPSHRGLLHKKLGIPQGERIPEAKIEAAKRSPSPALRKEATFAENFGHKYPQTHEQFAKMDHGDRYDQSVSRGKSKINGY